MGDAVRAVGEKDQTRCAGFRDIINSECSSSGIILFYKHTVRLQRLTLSPTVSYLLLFRAEYNRSLDYSFFSNSTLPICLVTIITVRKAKLMLICRLRYMHERQTHETTL